MFPFPPSIFWQFWVVVFFWPSRWRRQFQWPSCVAIFSMNCLILAGYFSVSIWKTLLSKWKSIISKREQLISKITNINFDYEKISRWWSLVFLRILGKFRLHDRFVRFRGGNLFHEKARSMISIFQTVPLDNCCCLTEHSRNQRY